MAKDAANDIAASQRRPMERSAEARQVVLIVEDDPAIGKAIARLTPKLLDSRLTTSVEQALRAVEEITGFAGAIVDIGLPDGSGLQVVNAIREQYATVPVMVLTSKLDRTLINEAHALGAEYVCKPEFGGNLRRFFERLRPDEKKPEYNFAEALEAVCKDASLTKRQAEILAHATDGVPRGHLAEVMGVSENTLKTQIKALLDKTRQSSLAELVWRVRSSAGEGPARQSS